jgi:hypothetical protein
MAAERPASEITKDTTSLRVKAAAKSTTRELPARIARGRIP